MPAYRNKHGLNKGKRFQGKGWRDASGGGLYSQLKCDSFSRDHGIRLRQTMDNLVGSLERDVEDDYPTLPEGLEFAFFLRKQPLVLSEELAFKIFDGGETVYVKIVDDDGVECVQCYTPGGPDWEVKFRDKKPKAEYVIATRGFGEANRLGILG